MSTLTVARKGLTGFRNCTFRVCSAAHIQTDLILHQTYSFVCERLIRRHPKSTCNFFSSVAFERSRRQQLGKMDKISRFFLDLKRKISQKIRRSRVEFLIQFEEFFICEKFFEFCGLPLLRWFEVPSDKHRKIRFYVMILVVVMFWLHTAVSLVIYARDKNQFVAATECLTYVGGLSFVLVKAFSFLYHRKTILGVVEKLDKHFPHRGLDQVHFGVRKYLKEVKTVVFLEILFSVISFAQMATYGFQQQIYGWLTSQDFALEHVLALWYPFDATNSVLFCIIWIKEAFELMITILILFSSDFLYFFLMAITAMEFDIVAQEVSEVEDAEEFKKLIDIHQELIEVTKKLEMIFSPMLLANVLGGIAVACTTAFLTNVRFFLNF